MKISFAIKRRIKQRPFWQPQTYEVAMACAVPEGAVASHTIIALPLNTDYQTARNITLSPALTPVLQTVGSNSSYLIANDLLKSPREIQLHYTVTVQPRRPNVPIHPSVKKVYDYTLGYLTYGNPIRGLYSYEQSVEKRCVDCGGFSSVMQKLLKDEGINSRIVAGFWAGYKTCDMHAWLEYEHSENVWIPLDASTDFLSQQGRTYKTGGCGYVGSDRIVVSTGSHHSINNTSTNPPISLTLDILQTPLLIQTDDTTQYIEDFSFSANRI